MTEENTTREERAKRQKRHVEAGLCRHGSATDSPCWRPATEKRFARDEEPMYCPEHLMAIEASDEVNGWRSDLDIIDEWIRGPVSEVPSGGLERLARNMLDEARREYARVSIEADAAYRVADARPDDVPTSQEAQLEISRRIVHADALNDARRVFEDFPEELLKVRDKWLVVDALADAVGDASDEVNRFKRERKL